MGTVELDRLAWRALFPETRFYLVKLLTRTSTEGPFRYDKVLAVYGDRRYRVAEFADLLAAHAIRVDDANRETIAQAFVLMDLALYVEEEIRFTSWEAGDWQSSDQRYTHRIRAWAKTQSLSVWYGFRFSDRLEHVTRTEAEVAYNPLIDTNIYPRVGIKDYAFPAR